MILPSIDDGDWAEVFGEGTGGNCRPIIPNRCPGDKTTSGITFSREDVKVIHGQSDGEKAERSWIVWGQLVDGRWFVARGDCDYTGWDCQAENSGDVASSMTDIITFGMLPEERERFGVMRL